MNVIVHIQRFFIICICLVSSSIYSDTRVVFYHNDALGSPVAATDENGEVIWREDYAPYGEKLGDDMEAVIENVGFTGHRQDTETGLIYAGARMYDPRLGRFMGVDPVSTLAVVDNPALFNRYAYANNNPYRYVDPNGEIPIDTVWDAANIVYDIGKISVGFATGNQKLVIEGSADLAADSIALLVPYAPAGSSKLARKGGVVAIKEVNGNSRLSQKAHHVYEIRNNKTGEVVKTGISG